MKKNFRKTALFLSAILSLALLAGCSGKAPTNPTPAPSAPSTPASAESNITPPPTADSNSIIYTNTKYGFSLTLPASWKGYSVIDGKWEGLSLKGEGSGKVTETGPLISIRDPRWTEQTPRQDIPVMVFTLDQWNSMKKEEFHIGAAPIDPSELGRNNKYVFALPARYNYAFPAGFEEVETIIKSAPLKTFTVN